MASLASILNDPNYINANEATKRAIFDRWSALDQNYTGANEATQRAIRQRFGVETAGQPILAPGEIPRPGPGMLQAPPEVPQLTPVQRVAGRVISTARPTVEALGAVGGAALGTPATPGVGTMLGAGLGYGLAKGGLDVLEQQLGLQKAPSSATEALASGARDVLVGGTLEAGGRIGGELVGKALEKVPNLRRVSEQRASNIVKQALGKDINQVLPALRNAGPNATVAELTAGIENPAWQALIERAAARDPQFVRKLSVARESEARATLAKLAGGATETDIRTTLTRAKEALNAMTGPQREAALNRANLGKAVAEYEATAGRLSNEAAAQVQEVRDLISAGNAAEAWARLDLIKRGIPVGATKYTYYGELADKAFNAWSSKAAQASLDLGQGARFAQGAADALRANGIEPLRADALVRSLSTVSRNPAFAGNDLLEGALKNVADDIVKWTESGGIIDARALDAIRKNSVNAAIQKMRPGFDATTQRNLAASVMTEIKPALVDAIESAGGAGYRKYLENYAAGAQKLAERKLVGRAAELWKTNKDEFVRLVMGESPQEVEKILGPGKYDIARELAENTMDSLRELAKRRIAESAVREQASEGQQALAELLKQNMKLFRLPNRLQSWIANTNTALATLEIQIGDRTMKKLTEALKTPQGAADLLETLSPSERNRVGVLLNKVAPIAQSARGATTATIPPAIDAAQEEETP